jgi:photosystem II stability/assembly factor-like uncharacterized protein
MASPHDVARRWLAFTLLVALSSTTFAQKGEWVPISDKVIEGLKAEGKKIGYPGLTAGVTVDPATGDVYMVVCDQGLWKSTDGGKSFARVDAGKIGGRCETGYALNFDPAGKRLACFMIYGPCASTADAGETWLPWKTNHLDFGVVDWEGTGQTILATRHESGGVLCMSTDGGKAWQDLGRAGPDKKIVKEDREFKALGIFDAKALVASRGMGIVRSTDAGRTWETVSDATPVAAVMVVRKGVGYWLTDRGVMTSKDRGETWSEGWRIKAVFGPYFGAKEGHVVVVGKDGFSESLDGGARWKVVAPLPPAFNTNRVGPNYAWDSLHDIFYASSMGKPTYRFER